MYTDADLHEAFMRDERERLALLAADERPQRNAYGELDLTGEQVDYTVTHDEVDRAIVELAGQRGQGYAETWDQVRILASGQNDAESLADAVMQLSQLPEGQTVALVADLSGPALARLIAKGHALPDGSYPIKDAADLHPAALLAQSGHRDHAAGRKHIKKRAKELGVDHSKLPGFGPAATGGSESLGSGGGSGEGPSGGAAAMTAGMRRAGVSEDAIALARRSGDGDGDEGTIDRLVRENPHLFAKAGAKSATTHPVGKVTTKTRAHSPDPDPSDRQHPRDGGVTHPEVSRYLRMLGTAGGREKPHGSVKSYGPRS